MKEKDIMAETKQEPKAQDALLLRVVAILTTANIPLLAAYNAFGIGRADWRLALWDSARTVWSEIAEVTSKVLAKRFRRLSGGHSKPTVFQHQGPWELPDNSEWYPSGR